MSKKSGEYVKAKVSGYEVNVNFRCDPEIVKRLQILALVRDQNFKDFMRAVLSKEVSSSHKEIEEYMKR